MTRRRSDARDGPVRRALRSRVPPLPRAAIRYGLGARDPAIVPLVLLQREVDGTIDAITDRIFADVERALETELRDGDLELAPGADAVRFDYDTRLLLPAMLTHGRLHLLADDLPLLRRVRDPDDALLARGRATTTEIVRALLDGDMRDAINDDEFVDFETTVRPRSRAAEIAQRRLQSRVEEWFDRPDTPDDVRRSYEHAVRLSEDHQDADRRFRDLLSTYRDGRPEDREPIADRIREEYKFAAPAERADLFASERDFPYFATQYERVGIIYEDMLNMYEADLGIDLGADYKRSIVLMVIAAQIGLDDTDDYPEDRGSQLTPVTAEVNLSGPAAGVATLRGIAESYLDRAARYSPDHLTGLAIEYIRQESLDRIAGLPSVIASGTADGDP